MVLTEDVKGNPLPCKLYCDGYLHSNLVTLHQKVEKKWDSVGLYVGYSGDGKSVMALQVALALDSTFGIERVVFTAEQFEEAVDKARPGESIVWDEADDLADNWNSTVIKIMKKKMKRIRKKRLHIILVTPTLFDMNKYFVIDRSMYLVHVYAKGLERGFFRFFDRQGKKFLYLRGKKDWDMRAGKPVFFGKFTDIPKGFPIDMSEDGEYERKKDEASKQMLVDDKSTRQSLLEYRRECLERLRRLLELEKDVRLTQGEYGEVFGVNHSNISRDFKVLDGGVLK